MQDGETGEGDQEPTYRDERGVMSRIVERLYGTPRTNIALPVNYTAVNEIKVSSNLSNSYIAENF